MPVHPAWCCPAPPRPGQGLRRWAIGRKKCSRPWCSCKAPRHRADQAFPIICATLASAAADVELRAIEEFGELGQAVFDFIAQGSETGVSGLFGEEAMALTRPGHGWQGAHIAGAKLAEKMISANLIGRPGHGIYTVADPFVRKVWLERRKLRSARSNNLLLNQ